MWDLGGQDVCRETWEAYYPNTEVCVCVCVCVCEGK